MDTALDARRRSSTARVSAATSDALAPSTANSAGTANPSAGCAANSDGTFAGVDVDVETNPKMGDRARDFAQSSRSRGEMSAGQRISPNDANLSEIGGFKDKF